jgi:hypothetical protein
MTENYCIGCFYGSRRGIQCFRKGRLPKKGKCIGFEPTPKYYDKKIPPTQVSGIPDGKNDDVTAF